ncbi:unnamed protein product [Merluccius merluccius]
MILLRKADLEDDIRRLSNELRKKDSLLSSYFDVAASQSVKLASLSTALQDTVGWHPSICPQPSACSTPNHESSWSEVVIRGRKRGSKGAPRLSFSNRYAALSADNNSVHPADVPAAAVLPVPAADVPPAAAADVPPAAAADVPAAAADVPAAAVLPAAADDVPPAAAADVPAAAADVLPAAADVPPAAAVLLAAAVLPAATGVPPAAAAPPHQDLGPKPPTAVTADFPPLLADGARGDWILHRSFNGLHPELKEKEPEAVRNPSPGSPRSDNVPSPSHQPAQAHNVDQTIALPRRLRARRGGVNHGILRPLARPQLQPLRSSLSVLP